MLPTSADDGLVECVQAVALARVLSEHRSIHKYLQLHSPDPQGGLSCMLPRKSQPTSGTHVVCTADISVSCSAAD